jgi:predicted TIM-barrel fold metal-dependent hydrolase
MDGVWYEVHTSVNNREPLFLVARERARFEQVLCEARVRYAFELRGRRFCGPWVSFYIKPADGFELPVLIHTGESGVDSPNRFEPFFAACPKVRFILAHCRPADTAIAMFRAYRNVYGDSAFAPPERIRAIIDAGFAERIMPGTDFSITHYYKNRNLPANRTLSLREQYTEDAARLRRIPD